MSATTDQGPPAPTSAYVHVPFCRHRCGYCNFTVVAGREDLVEQYLAAVERELRGLQQPQPVRTLFLGGGTPTHLTDPQLQRFLDSVRSWFPLRADGEFSVEANPEDLSEEKVALLVAAGVNRVSLGMQSFDQRKLQVLERSHQPEAAERCLRLLRPHIPSVSIDLIFGAPDESLSRWEADLRRALECDPDHISTYGLTYERGTRFFARQRRSEWSPLAEETERQMYERAIDRLTEAGFDHYEVSNFAKPGHRCRHNENYWLCGEYFGIGPGASSYVGGVRRSNHRSTSTYLKLIQQGRSPVVETDALDARDKAHERLVFGLRRLEGIDRNDLFQTSGFRVEELVGQHLPWLCEQGLLACRGDRIQLTRRGLLVSDSIWPYLL